MISRLRNFRRVDCWLIAFGGCCLAVLALELFWPHPLSSPAGNEQPETIVADKAGSSWHPGALASYQPIADRPLFTMDRKPWTPPTTLPAPPPPPPGPSIEFQLSALITTGRARMALLKTNVSPELRKISIDETIEGWTLIEVREDRVVLRRGDEMRIVMLKPGRAPSGLTESTALARQL